jgi:stage IV sporulation protein FB
MFQTGRKRWKVFAMFGCPIFVEPFFILLCLFFVFEGLESGEQFPYKLLWVPILFVSIVWHEVGHALAIRRYGFGPSTIVLHGLGGVTINTNRANSAPKESMIISAAGPAFSFSLTLIFGAVALLFQFFDTAEMLSDSLALDLFYQFCMLTAVVNVIWTVFNLLPILPMDGGQILYQALILRFKERRRALLTAAYASLATLGAGVILGWSSGWISPVFLILFAFLFAFQNFQFIKQSR